LTNEQLTEEVIRLEKTQAAQQEQIKTLFGRVDKQDALIEVLRTQTATIGTLADGQARIEKKVGSLSGELDEIKQKPAKKWENAVDIVFKLVLTAMVGVLLAKMGL
jgi:predicted RNase H-like nuclease (RuvC/YqgF family)